MEKTNFTYTIEQLESLLNLKSREEYVDLSFVTDIGADLVEQKLILDDCKAIYNEDVCIKRGTCDLDCVYAGTCVLKDNGRSIDNKIAIVMAKAKQRIPIENNIEEEKIKEAYKRYTLLLMDKQLQKKLPSVSIDEFTKMILSRNFSLVFNEENKTITDGRHFLTQALDEILGRNIAEEIAVKTFQKSFRECR